jgi:hypothetical protein
MELLEAVRSALPPDTTPLMIGAMVLVILALGRETEPRRAAEPQRRRHS